MATGLHLTTVAFSVRNRLAQLSGQQHPEQLLEDLQELWLPNLDLDEVQSALAALVERGLVKACDGGRFVATDHRIFIQRPNYKALAENDPRAWEGWS